MKMVRKLMMVLVAAALVLPAAGFAEVKAADGTKPAAVTRQKPVIAAPADCVVTGKTSSKGKGGIVTEKRKQIHARKGITSGEAKLVVHDHAAAQEHGTQRDDK